MIGGIGKGGQVKKILKMPEILPKAYPITIK